MNKLQENVQNLDLNDVEAIRMRVKYFGELPDKATMLELLDSVELLLERMDELETENKNLLSEVEKS